MARTEEVIQGLSQTTAATQAMFATVDLKSIGVKPWSIGNISFAEQLTNEEMKYLKSKLPNIDDVRLKVRLKEVARVGKNYANAIKISKSRDSSDNSAVAKYLIDNHVSKKEAERLAAVSSVVDDLFGYDLAEEVKNQDAPVSNTGVGRKRKDDIFDLSSAIANAMKKSISLEDLTYDFIVESFGIDFVKKTISKKREAYKRRINRVNATEPEKVFDEHLTDKYFIYTRKVGQGHISRDQYPEPEEVIEIARSLGSPIRLVDKDGVLDPRRWKLANGTQVTVGGVSFDQIFDS